MSLEDDLRKAGIDPGVWQEIKLKKPRSLTDLAKTLEKLKTVLQRQLTEDQQKILGLRELQNRDRFGGGE